MIVSFVIDPACFENDYISSAINFAAATELLKNIKINGLLLVDPQKRILQELCDKMEDLHDKYGQHLRIWFEEILKKQKIHLVVANNNPNFGNISEFTDLAVVISDQLNADALIEDRNYKNRLSGTGPVSSEVVYLSNYSHSQVEKKRDYYANQLPPIHELDEERVDEIFIQVVKYARWLRIYDKQIGKGNNTENFRKGIEYILGLWMDYGLFSDNSGQVEIITQLKNPDWPNHPDNLVALEKVEKNLMQPLKNTFLSFKLKLQFQEFPEDRFHARYLQSNNVIVLVEAGFDLFESNTNTRKFKDNNLKLANASREYLKRFRPT